MAPVGSARQLPHSVLYGHKAEVVVFDAAYRIQGILAAAKTSLCAVALWAAGVGRYGSIPVDVAALDLTGGLQNGQLFICVVELCYEVSV